MNTSLIEKLLSIRNDGEGKVFNPDYDVKNQLFEKVLIAKKYSFYPKLVMLFENDCKRFRSRLGENWYKNELARYMLYRKYNIKDVRSKCDNFPISECDSSAYSENCIYRLNEEKEKLKNEPWLTTMKNGNLSFFADTITPPWTTLRAMIEYCYMVDRVEIFEEDSYEDLKGHHIFNFKVPDAELEIISKKLFEDAGIKSYEVALCDYIIENIVSIIELFEQHFGTTDNIKKFLRDAHSGSGANYILCPKELLNRSRDPYLNRKISPEVELPNAGRVWDYGDILLLLLVRWYVKNVKTNVNVSKYISELDIDLKYLSKIKKENKEIKNIKLWLNYYKEQGGWDNFIESHNLQDFVYKKDDNINKLIETHEHIDTEYSEKYGYPIELFKGHLYRYDFSDGIDEAMPYAVHKADSVEEDFPFAGYVNGVEDFNQLFKNHQKFIKNREERILKAR